MKIIMLLILCTVGYAQSPPPADYFAPIYFAARKPKPIPVPEPASSAQLGVFLIAGGFAYYIRKKQNKA